MMNPLNAAVLEGDENEESWIVGIYDKPPQLIKPYSSQGGIVEKVYSPLPRSVGRDIRYATRHCSAGCLKSLLRFYSGHPVINEGNQFGMTALHFAAYAGDYEKIYILIDNGANVHVRTTKKWVTVVRRRTIYPGSTPLHCAAIAQRPITVTVLRNEGADEREFDCKMNFAKDYLRPRWLSSRRIYRALIGGEEPQPLTCINLT